jgi:hypothetical protein
VFSIRRLLLAPPGGLTETAPSTETPIFIAATYIQSNVSSPVAESKRLVLQRCATTGVPNGTAYRRAAAACRDAAALEDRFLLLSARPQEVVVM